MLTILKDNQSHFRNILYELTSTYGRENVAYTLYNKNGNIMNFYASRNGMVQKVNVLAFRGIDSVRNCASFVPFSDQQTHTSRIYISLESISDIKVHGVQEWPISKRMKKKKIASNCTPSLSSQFSKCHSNQIEFTSLDDFLHEIHHCHLYCF